jgi:hypothetical protein
VLPMKQVVLPAFSSLASVRAVKLPEILPLGTSEITSSGGCRNPRQMERAPALPLPVLASHASGWPVQFFKLLVGHKTVITLVQRHDDNRTIGNFRRPERAWINFGVMLSITSSIFSAAGVCPWLSRECPSRCPPACQKALRSSDAPPQSWVSCGAYSLAQSLNVSCTFA